MATSIPGDPEGTRALLTAAAVIRNEAAHAARSDFAWMAFIDGFHENCALLGLAGTITDPRRGHFSFTLDIVDRAHLFNLLLSDLLTKGADA